MSYMTQQQWNFQKSHFSTNSELNSDWNFTQCAVFDTLRVEQDTQVMEENKHLFIFI